MKKKLLALSICIITTGAPTILHAEGNAGAGKDKAAACVSCHGDNGNSMVSTFPKLAQQHSSYLIRQLKSFKDGSRQDAMMASIAKNLSDDDMRDIGAYYASQKISENALPVVDDEDDAKPAPAENKDKAAAKPEAKKDENVKALIALGSSLYRNGDLTREVSACIACHGPYGEGNRPAAFPALRSQHADYLIKSLNDFKSGARSNNPENMMHMIAKKMTDEEIKDVAYRLSMMKPN